MVFFVVVFFKNINLFERHLEKQNKTIYLFLWYANSKGIDVLNFHLGCLLLIFKHLKCSPCHSLSLFI